MGDSSNNNNRRESDNVYSGPERRRDAVQLAVMAVELAHIKTTLHDFKDMFEKKCITPDQFDPVKKIVYGLVAGFFAGFISLVSAVVFFFIKK